MRRSRNAAFMNVEEMEVELGRDEMKKEEVEFRLKVYAVDADGRCGDAEMRGLTFPVMRG